MYPMSNLKSFIWSVLFITGLSSVSMANVISENVIMNYRDRGLEVRYIKMNIDSKQELPKQVKIGEVNYPLYKTKEEAYDAVLKSGFKKDLTVVYVVSNVEKETETLSLPK
jgi:hypothetical protein